MSEQEGFLPRHTRQCGGKGGTAVQILAEFGALETGCTVSARRRKSRKCVIKEISTEGIKKICY